MLAAYQYLCIDKIILVKSVKRNLLKNIDIPAINCDKVLYRMLMQLISIANSIFCPGISEALSLDRAMPVGVSSDKASLKQGRSIR
jgi:hypothetical protein